MRPTFTDKEFCRQDRLPYYGCLLWDFEL